MVRLLPISSQSEFPVIELFQSHNGAIAAVQGFMPCTVNLSFNLTMVRLLHLLATNPSTQEKCFNPTMVRLLP